MANTINPKNSISIQGIDFVQTLCNKNNCFFNQIPQQYDYGIDAIIELHNDNSLIQTKLIEVQIKTGESYYTNTKCSFPIEQHYNYWLSRNLDVYGLVCNLNKKVFYFVNIKEYLKEHQKEYESGKLKTINFDITYHNTVSEKNFDAFFVKYIFKIIPNIDYYDVKQLLNSKFEADKNFGIHILWNHYINNDNQNAINKFFNIFKTIDGTCYITCIYYLSKITQNPDNWKNYTFSENTKKTLIKFIQNFTVEDILKLLSYADNNFERGTIAECIDFILQTIPNINNLLYKIIRV